jgi:hypothetical protein
MAIDQSLPTYHVLLDDLLSGLGRTPTLAARNALCQEFMAACAALGGQYPGYGQLVVSRVCDAGACPYQGRPRYADD